VIGHIAQFIVGTDRLTNFNFSAAITDPLINSAINKMVQIRFIIFIIPPVYSCCFVFNCNTKLDRVQQLIKAPKVQQ
jgi:hypothetical protein